MAHTVVGFFDQSSEAQTAIRELLARGFSRDRIDLSRGSGEAQASSGRRSDSEQHDNSLSGFFRNLFGSDKAESDRYTRVAERSNSIVTVHAASREEAEAAAGILDHCGAINVDERAKQYGFNHTRSDATGERQPVSSEPGTSVPRVDEHLDLGQREMERDNVRVRSRIVERPVEEHVRLREEQVHVERRPVDRPLSPNEGEAFRERTIELTERSEVPIVSKEARVVEEVRVRKEVSERDETVRDTLRRTDINIDKTNESGRSSTDPRDDTNDRPL